MIFVTTQKKFVLAITNIQLFYVYLMNQIKY